MSEGHFTLREWSGRLDSNQRPLDPQSSALPGCATPRHRPRVYQARPASSSLEARPSRPAIRSPCGSTSSSCGPSSMAPIHPCRTRRRRSSPACRTTTRDPWPLRRSRRTAPARTPWGPWHAARAPRGSLAEDEAHRRAAELERVPQPVLEVPLVAEVDGPRVAREEHEGGRLDGRLGAVVEARPAALDRRRLVARDRFGEDPVERAPWAPGGGVGGDLRGPRPGRARRAAPSGR